MTEVEVVEIAMTMLVTGIVFIITDIQNILHSF